MAEEKKEKKLYKHIDTDLDSELVIKNLNHNARKYVEFNHWDESKAREFYDALNNYTQAIAEGRLSTLPSGAISDSGSQLDNGKADWRDKDGNVLSQEQYESLSKRKKKKATQDFYANREVASYMNNILDQLAAKAEKPKGPAKFDIKDNVWTGFMKSIMPNGSGDVEAWMDLDPYDETTQKRGTANRAKAFSDYIEKYIGNLSDDMDFTDSPYKSKDEYVTALRGLQAELANGVDSADFRALSQMGANPAVYRAFFSTAKAIDPETGQAAEQPAAQTQTPAGDSEETKVKLNAEWNKFKNLYKSKNYQTYLPKAGAQVGLSYDTSKTGDDAVTAYLNAANAANLNFSVQALQNTSGNGYARYLAQYGTINPGAVRTVDQGEYAGWKYIPESLNKSDYSVLAYNPTNNGVKRLFYGDLGQAARDDFGNIIRSIYNYNETANKPYFQEGGTVEETTLEPTVPAGSILDVINSGTGAAATFAQRMSQQSAKTKADPKLRQPGKAANNYSDNQLTATDAVRLGAVAADVAALIDPEPFSALGLGVGSDVANLYADVKEGYGIGASLGNFAGNIALSAVGMIPIFGDAVGSGGKVVKTLVKFVPKINKALIAGGLLAGVSNAGEITKSLSKIGKDGPENEMNVNDWRNIATALQLVLGGANAVKNHRAVKQIQKAGKTTDMVDVVVKNKQTGEKKTLRFGDKEDVVKLRAAKTPEDINNVVARHPSLKDKYEVDTKSGSQIKWFGDQSKWYKPWSWRTKTETTGIADGAVNTSPLDFDKVRNMARESSIGNNRANYIASHTDRENPELIKLRELLGLPYYPAKAANHAPTNDFGPATSIIIQRAKNYKKRVGNLLNVKIEALPHTKEWKTLIKQGATPEELTALDMWKEGGKMQRVRKALGGFEFPTLNAPTIKMPWFMVKRQIDAMPKSTPASTTKNYGTNYTSDLDYSNGEYGTTKQVNLTGILNANAKLRDKNLAPAHQAEGYDYYNAQANTDKARKSWQDAGNREKDFMAWAVKWQSEHPNGTQSDMLADYNKLIDSMYQYKHEMGTDTYSGANSYRHDDKVAAFNQANKAVYGSANAPGGVHGYSTQQEGWNGTSTAQRFIDRTDADVTDFNWSFADDASDQLKGLFTGLVKDASGRYYVNQGETPAPAGNDEDSTETDPAKKQKPTTESPKSTFNFGNLLTEIAPNALAFGRYLAARNNNKTQLDIARKMPVLLLDPVEHHRAVYGDLDAIQRGRSQYAKLMHMAGQPITSDGSLQTAAMLTANQQGNQYIDEGERQNDAMEQATAEKAWLQEKENKENRHSTAMTNRSALVQHRINWLSALGGYHKSNYTSLDNLLAQWEAKAQSKADENKAYAEQINNLNLQNQINSDLAGAGISVTPAEQQLWDDLQTGKRKLSDLKTDSDEYKSYQRISQAVSEELTRRIAASKGQVYTPYISPLPATFTGDVVPAQGDGGKVKVQKLKNKIKKMELFQRSLENRMKNYEQDMDRAQRSSSQYMRAQSHKSSKK